MSSPWFVCCVFPGEGASPIQSCLCGQRDRQGLRQQPSPLSLWNTWISPAWAVPQEAEPQNHPIVTLAPGSEQEFGDLHPYKSVSWENPDSRALSCCPGPWIIIPQPSGSCCLSPGAESLMPGAAWGRGTGGSGWLVSHPGVVLFIYGLGPGPGTHKAARGELASSETRSPPCLLLGAGINI